MLSSIAIPARAVEANSGIDQLSALRSYAQQIGSTPSLKGATKVAEATSLFDAIRQSSDGGQADGAGPRGQEVA